MSEPPKPCNVVGLQWGFWIWSVSQYKWVGGAGVPPTWEFNLAVAPENVSIGRGKSGETTVTVTLVSGTPQTVGLSCSGQPSGVTTQFAPQSGTPTFQSILTITVGTESPLGSYPLYVQGSGGGVSKQKVLTLNIISGYSYSNTNVFDMEEPDLSGWTITTGGNGTVELDPIIKHGGAKSLRITCPAKTDWAKARHDLTTGLTSLKVHGIFYVYPVAGHLGSRLHVLEKVGIAIPASLVAEDDGKFYWNYTDVDDVGRNVEVPMTLNDGQWNKIEYWTDISTGKLILQVNGVEKYNGTLTWMPKQHIPEKIFMGDTSTDTHKGMFYYDDITVQNYIEA